MKICKYMAIHRITNLFVKEFNKLRVDGSNMKISVLCGKADT